MKHPVLTACAASAALSAIASWVGRSELDRRRAMPRRAIGDEDRLTDRAWLVKATNALHGYLGPDETVQRVTVAVRAADGDMAAYTMRRGDAMVEATYGGKP